MKRMDAPTDAERRLPTTLSEAIGGPVGMVETSLPGFAFVIAYLISGSQTETSAVVAVAVALAIAVGRLLRRESPRYALSGLVGVAFAAFIAARTGRAEDFYLPGLLINAAYGAAFFVSILVRRPLVGVIVGLLDGEGTGWRQDPARLRDFTRATWLWAGLFGVRLLVQLPLYLTHAVVLLGIARTATGLPLYALGLWLTWLLVRRTPAVPPAPPAPAAEA